MKEVFFFTLCLAAASGGQLLAQSERVSSFLPYLNHRALYCSDAEAQEIIDTSSAGISKGLAYFRRALLNSNDETLVLEASEYWTELYSKPQYKNPLVLAYDGVLNSMYGGATTRNVIVKTFHAKKGMKKLRKAMEEILKTEDNIAIFYVSYLQGRTHTSLPTFFSEFQNEALDNLKMAKKYLKAAEKEKQYGKPLIARFYSLLNRTYGRWYAKADEPKKALRYLREALQAIGDHSPEEVITIKKAIQEIENL